MIFECANFLGVNCNIEKMQQNGVLGRFLIKNRELHKFTLQIVSKICNVIIKLLLKKNFDGIYFGCVNHCESRRLVGVWVFRTLKVVKTRAIMGVLGGLGVIGSAESKLRVEN